MQTLLGLILGIALTIAAAFAYDTGTGRAANGLQPAAAGGNAPMVNWEVVSNNWHGWALQLHHAGLQIEHGWQRLVG